MMGPGRVDRIAAVQIDSWKIKYVGVWQNAEYSAEQEFYMNRLDSVEEYTQSIWNVCIKFDTQNNIENCTVIEENSVKRKPYK